MTASFFGLHGCNTASHKNFGSVLAAIILAVFVVWLPSICLSQTGQGSRPIAKNIVFIMLDDADFSDFGFNSHLQPMPDAVTPNMNALRAGGMLLPNFYAASSVCTPTRVSVLTGRNPMAFGAAYAWSTMRDINVTQGAPGTSGLPTNVPQLGLLMKAAGKATGHFGKWHVGRSRPEFRQPTLGFDTWGAFLKGPKPLVWDGRFAIDNSGTREEHDTDFLDRIFGQMVRDFIVEHAAAENGFYVNYWPFSPHYPLTAPADFDNSTTRFDLSTDRGRLLAMMHDIDREVGLIVETLRTEGILDDTLILLTSDNGGILRARHHAPYLRGTKNTLFEGGIRVSAVAHWPGRIDAGTTNPTVMTTSDLLPTFLEVAGHGLPDDRLSKIEGKDKSLALLENKVIAADPIYWEIETSSREPTDGDHSRAYAMRRGKYKILKPATAGPSEGQTRYMLFDLSSDPSEQQDISGLDPELTARLAAQMHALRASSTRIADIPMMFDRKAETLPTDPRLDVSRKDLTIRFTLNVPDNPEERQIFLEKEGAHAVWLESNRRLRWQIKAANDAHKPVWLKLVSDRLSPGPHEIVLSARGFKRAPSRFRLYVDGQVQADTDKQFFAPEFIGMWSSASPLTLGHEALKIEGFDYFVNWFTPEEIPVSK